MDLTLANGASLERGYSRVPQTHSLGGRLLRRTLKTQTRELKPRLQQAHVGVVEWGGASHAELWTIQNCSAD